MDRNQAGDEKGNEEGCKESYEEGNEEGCEKIVQEEVSVRRGGPVPGPPRPSSPGPRRMRLVFPE